MATVLSMIECVSLTKKYGDKTAVDSLDLHVARGEICVLMGPNGAGKSTTVKMLTGLTEPTSGRVRVAGGSPRDVKRDVGVLPENLGLFDDLTVLEHLELSAGIYGVPDAKPRIAQLLRVLGLEQGSGTYARECSHGMRKKTAFAMAVLHNPKVLFLDEPFEAIDPVSTRLMIGVLTQAAARGITVFLTSHILSIVEEIAHRYVLIRNGGVLLNSTRTELPRPIAELYFEIVEEPVTESLEWLRS